MSMHRSLKGASKIAKRRNVLKRYERIDLLKGRGDWMREIRTSGSTSGDWKRGDRAFGLPKTKPAE